MPNQWDIVRRPRRVFPQCSDRLRSLRTKSHHLRSELYRPHTVSETGATLEIRLQSRGYLSRRYAGVVTASGCLWKKGVWDNRGCGRHSSVWAYAQLRVRSSSLMSGPLVASFSEQSSPCKASSSAVASSIFVFSVWGQELFSTAAMDRMTRA